MDQHNESDEWVLSPCETREGSRHYTVNLSDSGTDDELDPEGLDETVIMSPALLEHLRWELKTMAAREVLHTRPTWKPILDRARISR